jgi:zinc protease
MERFVLPNGLETVLLPKTGVPLVTVEISIRAGGFIETPELNGLTHLHEHMFFKANRAYPDQPTYLRRLDDLGASWNGITSDEVVRYFFTVPSGRIREGLEFLRDAIGSPLFLPEELEKERVVVLGEYDRNEASPAFHLLKAVVKAMFAAHFSRKNVLGTREVIATATREKLRFIQETFYVPNNAALMIAGEFEPAAARSLAGEVFGDWERRPDPFLANPVPRHPPIERDEFLVVERDVRSATVLLGWHGPSVGEDADGAVAADVISMALNHPASRFHAALVDSGLATSARFSYHTHAHVGPIHLRLETEPGKVLDAVAVAREELDRMAEPGGLTAEDLTRAAQELVTEEAYSREHARDHAIAIGFWWSVGGIDLYLSFPQRVRSVGPADVEGFARKYLPAGGAKTIAAVLASPAASASAGLSPESIEAAFRRGMKARPAGARPAGSGAPSGRPVAATSASDLPSGARVLARRVPGAEVASLGIFFRGLAGRSNLEQAGTEKLLLRTIAEGIERRHARELALLGAKVLLDVGADHSMLGVRSLPGGLGRAAEIVAAELRGMELRAEDVDRNRARLIDRWRNLLDDPDDAVRILADRAIYPEGHPYIAHPGGTEESLRRIGISDLERRRTAILEGRKVLIAAAGDLEDGAALAMVELFAGGLPSGGEPGRAAPSIPEVPGGLLTEERAIPTCYIVGRFRAPAPGEKGFEALALALAILQRKMFIEVRTRRALTYAVLSFLLGRSANTGSLYITTTRPNEALAAMYETIDDLAGRSLPEEEFRGSSLTFLTRQHLGRETTSQQVETMAAAEIVAGDHRRAFDLEERYGRLRPEDIAAALREHVRSVRFGVMGPRELIEKLDRGLLTSR